MVVTTRIRAMMRILTNCKLTANICKSIYKVPNTVLRKAPELVRWHNRNYTVSCLLLVSKSCSYIADESSQDSSAFYRPDS